MADKRIGNPRDRAFRDSIENKGEIDRGMTSMRPDPMAPGSMLEVLGPPLWEYKSVLLARDANINSFGADRWDLISVIPQPGDNAMYYFRRPKPETPAQPATRG